MIIVVDMIRPKIIQVRVIISNAFKSESSLLAIRLFVPNRPVIRDTLSRTNLVVMIDDPVISANLGELIIQLQSGLTMGSRTAGVSTPGGSLLITSNDSVMPRYVCSWFVVLIPSSSKYLTLLCFDLFLS